MVPDRLVDEAPAVEVQQHAVFAVVVGHLPQLVGSVGCNSGRNQVPVEPGLPLAERCTGGKTEPQAIPGAVRVGSQREIAGKRVDVALAQFRVATEAAGRE